MKKPNSKTTSTLKVDFNSILFIFAIAFLMRIIPIMNGTNWTDLYEAQAMPILKHQNIYSATHMVFPYSPVSMFIPATCAFITLAFHVPFQIVMKMPCMLADIAIAISIYIILAKRGDKSAHLLGVVYALNPVSILISSFHGNLIVIPTLFTLLAYSVLLDGIENNYRLSALILGLAIGLRGYPVLLLPFFIMKIGLSWKRRLAYVLYAIVPTTLSFIPFFLLDPKALLREVFAYSGFTDYGLAAILRAVYSFQSAALAYGLPNNTHIFLLNSSKWVFIGVYLIILIVSMRGMSLIRSIIAVFLAFYFIVSGVSSQYFIWVLPFAFLMRGIWLWCYIGLVSWALINFYWLYHPYIIFGKLVPIAMPLKPMLLGEIFALTSLWIFCFVWAIVLITRSNKTLEGDFL